LALVGKANPGHDQTDNYTTDQARADGETDAGEQLEEVANPHVRPGA